MTEHAGFGGMSWIGRFYGSRVVSLLVGEIWRVHSNSPRVAGTMGTRNLLWLKLVEALCWIPSNPSLLAVLELELSVVLFSQVVVKGRLLLV